MKSEKRQREFYNLFNGGSHKIHINIFKLQPEHYRLSSLILQAARYLVRIIFSG